MHIIIHSVQSDRSELYFRRVSIRCQYTSVDFRMYCFMGQALVSVFRRVQSDRSELVLGGVDLALELDLLTLTHVTFGSTFRFTIPISCVTFFVVRFRAAALNYIAEVNYIFNVYTKERHFMFMIPSSCVQNGLSLRSGDTLVCKTRVFSFVVPKWTNKNVALNGYRQCPND